MDWPITAWARSSGAQPEFLAAEPFALVDRGARGLVLAGLNPVARALGLGLGQAHADASAMVPNLRSEPVKPGQAQAALRRLALWAQRYAPLVACDDAIPGMEGLWIETTGADHLLGGEAALIADLTERLARAGIPARVGLAGTPGAAWALARFAPSLAAIAPPAGEAATLAPLPMAALRLSAAAVQLLGRFGLRRIGDLYALPRSSLARRFRGETGMQLVRRLDQALGRMAEPLLGETAPTPHFAHRVFAEPIQEIEALAHWAMLLANDLCTRLESDGLGARQLTLTGFRADGLTTRFSVGLGQPSRDPAHLLRLLRERGWALLDMGFGLDALRLSASITELLLPSQIDCLGKSGVADTGKALAELIDRLTARLGENAVLAPVFRETWLPERAELLAPYAASRSAPRAKPPAPSRPILFLSPPEPIEAMAELPDGAPARFTWRRVSRRVARASGPERLSPEWWLDGGDVSSTRDYYRVEDDAGARFWVFRDGLYDEGAARRLPTWWMHGLFP